jgi:hypothetical protein
MRRFMSVVVGCVALLATSVVVAPSSQAANNDQTQSVYRYWVSYSPALGTCARYSLTATIKFRSTYSPAKTSYPTTPKSYMVSNAKLYNPVLRVNTYAYSAANGCTLTKKNLTKITFAQHWGGHGCSFNPSISVGVPWAVGVSFWPSCGTKYQAKRSSSFGSGSTFTQNNSNNGNPIATWSGSLAFRTNTPPPDPCLSVFIDSKIVRGTADDSYGSGEVSAQKVCLDAVYK